ncbi:MAG: hypothetical protein ACRCT1_05760 [Microcoleaceae cyanobacterium]
MAFTLVFCPQRDRAYRLVGAGLSRLSVGDRRDRAHSPYQF